MTKALKRIQTATYIVAWFSLYFALVSFALFIAGNDISRFLKALLMLLTFGGTIFLSARAKHMSIYILYHGGLIALLWGLERTAAAQGIADVCILTAALLIQAIILLVKRIHTAGREYQLKLSPLLTVIFFILWIIVSGMKLSPLAGLLPVIACIYMLATVLGIYLDNMMDYIESNKQMANMPAAALIRSGNVQMAIFMLLGVAGIFLFTHIGLDRLLEQLKNLLLAGIRFLFSLAPSSTDEATQAPVNTPQMPSVETPLNAPEAPSRLMIAISNVLMTVVEIALIVGAAALAIYIIYQIWQRFNGISFQKKKAREITRTEDVIEKLEAPKHRRHSSLFTAALPEEKIRRIYYKKIQGRHKKDPVSPNLTPTELTQSINPQDSDAARQFTQIYEQARYSKETPGIDSTAYKNLGKRI